MKLVSNIDGRNTSNIRSTYLVLPLCFKSTSPIIVFIISQSDIIPKALNTKNNGTGVSICGITTLNKLSFIEIFFIFFLSNIDFSFIIIILVIRAG